MKLFFLKFIAFLGGSFFCFFLQKELNYIPVLAAAVTGFLGSFLHFPKIYEKKGLHNAIYAGSFAGMCSEEIIHHPILLVPLSLIGTFFYLSTLSRANGFGGKLGTIAFLSSFILLVIESIW